MPTSALLWTMRPCMTFASGPLSSPLQHMGISITSYQLPYVEQRVLFVSQASWTVISVRYDIITWCSAAHSKFVCSFQSLSIPPLILLSLQSIWYHSPGSTSLWLASHLSPLEAVNSTEHCQSQSLLRRLGFQFSRSSSSANKALRNVFLTDRIFPSWIS